MNSRLEKKNKKIIKRIFSDQKTRKGMIDGLRLSTQLIIVDASFCPGYFIQFLFLGPRDHLRRVSSLGLETFSFMSFIESLNYFIFYYLFVLIFSI